MTILVIIYLVTKYFSVNTKHVSYSNATNIVIECCSRVYPYKAHASGYTLDQLGISVRYQDGGMGTVFGKARFALPIDESTMLDLHKAFRSNSGLANKLIKPVTEE